MFAKMEKPTLQYVFRGTTIGYRGNPSNNKIPATPTTINPAKALAFALCAQYMHGVTGIVYIANLQTIQACEKIEANWFESDEEEIGFSVSPGDFQDRCLGYILASDLRTILKNEGFSVKASISLPELTDVITKIRVMNIETIDRIVGIITPQTKNM